MEQKRNIKGQSELTDVLPILAATALGSATGEDDKVKHLLVELIEDQLEKRRKEKDKVKRLAESSVQAAKEAEEIKQREQRRCNHRKQDGKTRLAGQRLSNGQLSLVCLYCNKNFFFPPQERQEAPPRELVPSADELGG